MDNPYIYEIQVERHLPDGWSDWFDGMAICYDPGGVTMLKGPLPDQAALLGVLNKLQSLNLTVISVNRLSLEE
jgi:hypothetical protein